MTMLTFRSDESVDRLLAELARPGETRSDTIRRALQDAVTFARRERMRREAIEVAGDAADRAEAQAVLADLEDLRAW